MPPVPAQHGAERELADRALLLRLDEGLGLDEAQAHPEADDDHDGREQERHAPAPREEVRGPLAGALGVREQEVDREEHRVRDDEAERRAELREGAVPGALAGGGVLGRDERRARPLAAEREALREAQDQQQAAPPTTPMSL